MPRVTLSTVTCLLFLCSALATPAVEFKGGRLSALPSTREVVTGPADASPTAGDVSSTGADVEAKVPPTNCDLPPVVYQAYPEDVEALAEEAAEEATIPLSRSKRQVFRLQDLMDAVRLIGRDRVYPNKAYWYIQNISNHIAKAEVSSTTLTSDLYVVAGYTVRLMIGIKDYNKELYFGAYLLLCPGINDDYLHWPFRIPHTFSFDHPTTSANDKKMKLTPEGNPAYRKPIGDDCNRGNGFPRIIKVSEARQQGLIKDDAISVALHFHPGA